jgi:hypothetical protein
MALHRLPLPARRGAYPFTAAAAAAVAACPGTIQIIQQRPDGSYVAHVIRADDTEVHVIVSKAFKVTGPQAAPPAGGPRRSPGQAPA